MKAVILAAGYGNRMRPLTDHLHKTLLKIGDQTIYGGDRSGGQRPALRRVGSGR